MKAMQLLHNLGQSLWHNNITRDLLDRGTVKFKARRLISESRLQIGRSDRVPQKSVRTGRKGALESWQAR